MPAVTVPAKEDHSLDCLLQIAHKINIIWLLLTVSRWLHAKHFVSVAASCRMFGKLFVNDAAAAEPRTAADAKVDVISAACFISWRWFTGR